MRFRSRQLDAQVALVTQYEGTIKTDQSQIDNAKLNLVYCHITSPITGRVGLRLVDPGNIVQATSTNGLVVITQLDPISVIFTMGEDQLPPILDRMHAGQKLHGGGVGSRELRTSWRTESWRRLTIRSIPPRGR